MHTVTIAVDLAKTVFELAVANSKHRISGGHHLSRKQFERFRGKRELRRVVMEACASAHVWARRLLGLGFDVVLLPPHDVRPNVRRNKTDRTDGEALLEALRCGGIHPVSIKSEDQQAIAALHRVRSQWMGIRAARSNRIRTLAHEFGLKLSAGADGLLKEIASVLEDAEVALPDRVRWMIHFPREEVRALEARVAGIDKELERLVRQEPALRPFERFPASAS